MLSKIKLCPISSITSFRKDGRYGGAAAADRNGREVGGLLRFHFGDLRDVPVKLTERADAVNEVVVLRGYVTLSKRSCTVSPAKDFLTVPNQRK